MTRHVFNIGIQRIAFGLRLLYDCVGCVMGTPSEEGASQVGELVISVLPDEEL